MTLSGVATPDNVMNSLTGVGGPPCRAPRVELAGFGG